MLYLCHVHANAPRQQCYIAVLCSYRQCTKTAVPYICGMFMSSMHQDDSAIPVACSCRQCTRMTVLYLWHVHVVNAPGRQCYTCGVFMSSVHQADSAIHVACSCRQCTRTTVLYLWLVHVVNAPGRQCYTCGMFMSPMHRTTMLYLRHVHVVNEDEQSLGRRRAVRVLGAFLHVGLQTALHVQRGGATGEVQVHQHLQHASLRPRVTTTTTRFVSKSILSNIC